MARLRRPVVRVHPSRHSTGVSAAPLTPLPCGATTGIRCAAAAGPAWPRAHPIWGGESAGLIALRCPADGTRGREALPRPFDSLSNQGGDRQGPAFAPLSPAALQPLSHQLFVRQFHDPRANHQAAGLIVNIARHRHPGAQVADQSIQGIKTRRVARSGCVGSATPLQVTQQADPTGLSSRPDSRRSSRHPAADGTTVGQNLAGRPTIPPTVENAEP